MGVPYIIVLVYFFLAIPIENCNGNEKGVGELISVVALMRHGDRAPYTTFPKDHYYDLSYWPMGHGQLTNKGKDRLYQLGKWLRNRYNTFLSHDYLPKEIYTRSTDVDRCLASASVALAGLYPPQKSTWSIKQLWQPIPIHTKAFPEDEILGMRKECGKYTELYHRTMQSEYYKNITLTYKDLFRYVSQHSGWDIVDLDQIKVLQTIFDIYNSYNKSFIPPWAEYIDHKALQYLAGVKHEAYTHTKMMQRLVTGPFWDTIFRYFDGDADNMDFPKFVLLVAHDITIVALLNTMGVYDFVPPSFGATLIWELYKNSKGYYVNVVYKMGVKLRVLQVEGCQEDCGYGDLKRILRHVTIDVATWEKECRDFPEVVKGANDTMDKFWFSRFNWNNSKPFFVT